MKKKFFIAMAIFVFSITMVGCGSKTVAKVNGQKINQTELDKRIKKSKLSSGQQNISFTGQQGEQMLKELERQTLDGMIEELLMQQAAKKEGVNPSQSEIQQAIDGIKSKFGGEAAFNQALKQFNYTIKDMEDLTSRDIVQTNLLKKITSDIQVTDEDIRNQYNNNKKNYIQPAKIEARAILVRFDSPGSTTITGQPAPKVNRNEQDARKNAEGIINQLNNGADFVKLAKEKSEDENSKNDGGLIKGLDGKSPYDKGTIMPKEFDEAAVSLKVGSYTKNPVKTSQGFYIIKLESLLPEKQLSFDEAKEQIKEELLSARRQEKFNQYLTKFRDESKIENILFKDSPAQPSTGMPGSAGNGGVGSAKPGTANPHGPGGSIPLDK